MNEYDLPPMSPDDLQALMGVAGPLFGESRMIEQMTSDNTVSGSHIQDGSMKIKSALEQAQRQVQAHRPPPPQYAPPQYVPQEQFVQPQQVPVVQPITNGVSTFTPQQFPSDDGQMMFQFDKKEQSITNDLLKEISKKLTKVIDLLDKKERVDIIPKQKPNVKTQI